MYCPFSNFNNEIIYDTYLSKKLKFGKGTNFYHLFYMIDQKLKTELLKNRAVLQNIMVKSKMFLVEREMHILIVRLLISFLIFMWLAAERRNLMGLYGWSIHYPAGHILPMTRFNLSLKRL